MRYDNGEGFSFEIYGESHAPYIGVKASGIKKGERIDVEKLKEFLNRRKPTLSVETARKEADEPIIISGIEDGVITGDIEIRFNNNDVKKEDYEKYRYIPRPSTADYPRMINEGAFFTTGGGAYSGRMTLPYTAIGGILKQILERKGITVKSHILSIGELKGQNADGIKGELPNDAEFLEKVNKYTERIREDGDSLGGVIECVATGLPVGLGGALLFRLESVISEMLFAIPSVKGVEFGSGFSGSEKTGSYNNDAITVKDGKITFLKNDAGGILGGMASGMPLVVKVAFKPIASIGKPQNSVNLKTMKKEQITVCGRHDCCMVKRGLPIVESGVILALYSAMTRVKNITSIEEYREKIDGIDDKIVKLINDRIEAVKEIGKIKKTSGKKILDVKREEEIKTRLKTKYPEIAEIIDNVYSGIFDGAKKEEENV